MKLRSTLRGLQSLTILTWALVVAGKPKRRTLTDRLKQIPLDGVPLDKPVTIHWNAHHMPFIEAETDHDCAVALGVVQAHLRLGQMEMMRRIAQGRTAEMVGPGGVELDHALRAFNFAAPVPRIVAAMDEHTRNWIESFVIGINYVLMNSAELPPEFAWLALQREPWTIEDIVTIGRLSGADVHWMIWLKLLRFRKAKDWPNLWDRLLEQGVGGVEAYSMSGNRDEVALGKILAESRSGSNSFAVAAGKSSTGNAWIASDPHLPITTPNVWMFCGFKCPSYHVIGMMLPALPFVGIGRNPDIAWGGTNLHAGSTDLIDVTDEPAAALPGRIETIKVRGGKPVVRTIRESKFGPVISDAPLIATGDNFALKWAGHEPTDEIGAMLAFNRATNWQEFSAAADKFGVPGQNFIYADAKGHVGKLIASLLPKRKAKPSSKLLSDPSDAADWASLATSKDLPRAYDPECGFAASANDEPADPGFPVGFFYSSFDRIRRISSVLADTPRVTIETLAHLQRDVMLEPALSFRDLVMERFDKSPQKHRHWERVQPVADALRDWDGSYNATSEGALAFETVQLFLLYAFHPPAERAAFSSVWHMRQLMERTLAGASHGKAARIVGKVFERAAPVVARYKVWGAVHHMRLRHPLGVLPIIGKRFQFAEWEAAGNEDTVMKTGVPTKAGVHGISYGSMARHISDMSHPDQNYFAILGGQDGWIGSDTVLDQVPLWREGKYIKVPLNPETVRQTFLYRTELKPR